MKQIYSLHSNPRVNKHLPYETWNTWDDAERWYAYILQRQSDGIAEQFVITAGDHLIGTCVAFEYCRDTQQIEFGYVLAENCWGKGCMHEAMQAFVPALRDTLNLSQLNANVEKANTQSLSLLAKLGFVQVNTFADSDGIKLCRLSLKFSEF